MPFDSVFSSVQIEYLSLLSDGEWHDRQEMREKLNLKFLPSNISQRIINPLEKRGIIEQSDVPLKHGSRKKKRVARLIPGPDGAARLYLLSALRNQCETLQNERDLAYQKAKRAWKADEKMLVKLTVERDHYKDLYNRFNYYYNYFINNDLDNKDPSDWTVVISQDWSPAMAELMKIAANIEQHCTSRMDAEIVSFKVRPDLSKAHRDWQIANYPTLEKPLWESLKT